MNGVKAWSLPASCLWRHLCAGQDAQVRWAQGCARTAIHARRIASLLLIGIMSSHPTGVAAAQADAANAHRQKNAKAAAPATDLKKIRGEIRQLRSTLDSARDRQKTLRTKLSATEKDMGKTSRSLQQLQQQLQRHTQSLHQLRQRQQQHQSQLSTHRNALTQQMRASYAMGRQRQQDFLKIVFNQQDPTVVGRNLSYYGYFNRAHVAHISQITASLAELETLEQATQTQTQRLTQVQSETERTRQQLEASRKKRSTILVALSSEIQGKEQRLQQLLEDERGLERLLKRLRDAQKRAKPTPPAKSAKPGQPGQPKKPRDTTAPDRKSAFGRLQGQLDWPTQGALVARYGTSRKLGTSKWQGVLISAPEGAEVRAVSRGKVVFADWMRGFGLLIILDHGDGYMTLYGQNQAVNKDVGTLVNAGDVIASVGDSGGQMSPGLYFEIRRDGVPVNPAAWCR